MAVDVLRATIGSALTLCMMAVLLRWSARALAVDLHRGHLRFVPSLTDPLLRGCRKLFPPTRGVPDWSPLLVLLGLWILRVIFTGH